MEMILFYDGKSEITHHFHKLHVSEFIWGERIIPNKFKGTTLLIFEERLTTLSLV
jgi:hypothetical protein